MPRIQTGFARPHGAPWVVCALTLVFILCQAFAAAHGATYTMSLQTDAPSYSGLSPITITGTVSPAPGTDTAVIITIKDQAGTVADVTEVVPSPTDGTFSYTSHPGGNAAWTSGAFTVNATWGGDGTSASQVVTFNYAAPATSSTSSTSASTSSSSSATKSSSTTSSSSSKTSASTSTSAATTSTSTSAPEFPSGALAVTALVGVAVVALLSRGARGDEGAGGFRSGNQLKTD